MRLSAYKKMIDATNGLPDVIEGADYFKCHIHNPKQSARQAILNYARKDVALFHGEFSDLFDYEHKDIRSNHEGN